MSETEVSTEGQVVDTDSLDDFADDYFGQKPAADTPATTEDTEQDTETTETKGETEAQTDDEDEAELSEEVKETPKKKTVQDRIDELVRQREEVRREAAAEIAKIRQEFEDLKKGATPSVQTERVEPAPTDLDDQGEPVYPLGEFDPQYIRDLTRYTLTVEGERLQAQNAQVQAASAAQQEAQALQVNWNGRVEAATTEYPDFVEKCQELLNGFNELPTEYAGYLSNVLMNMDKGTDVLYYLSNHPDEAREIVNSGAQKATLALGRIEARFMNGEDTAAQRPKVSKAPPPAPVRARGTNGAFISVAPDTDDLDLFQEEFFKKK